MRRYIFTISNFLVIFFIFNIVVSCSKQNKNNNIPPEIPVVKVLQKDVPLYKEFVGQVYGYSDIPIRARVTGFLTGIHFKEGFRVKKGQLLYTIDPAPFLAKVATQESHLAEAKTQLAKAESDLNRIKPLAEINAVSQSDLDAALAEYAAALSYVHAQEANLDYAKIDLSYCWIKSPITGIIGKTNARVGEYVGQAPNPVILSTVSTIDTVRVEFFLTEADYIRLAREYPQLRDFNPDIAKRDKYKTLQLVLSDGSIFKYKGYMNFINREVDPQTGTLLVQTTFPNPDYLLKPGLYAKVVVKMKDVKGALLVPQRSIMELQGQHSVFVVTKDSVVNSKQIVTGQRVGNMWIVKEGLNPEDMVVIDAIQKVGSGIKVSPVITDFKSTITQKYE
jgi:membrane fusion protein (multidrug efflux system)